MRSWGAEALARRLGAYTPPRTGLPAYEDWLGAGRGSPLWTDASPAITLHRYKRGVAAYVAADVFRTYYSYRHWPVRRLIRNLIDLLIPDKLVEVEAPPTVEVTLRRNASTYIIHLVNWNAGRVPSTPFMCGEEVLPVPSIHLKLRVGRWPARVGVMPPGEAEASWDFREGLLEVEVSNLRLHAMIVVEVEDAG